MKTNRSSLRSGGGGGGNSSVTITFLSQVLKAVGVIVLLVDAYFLWPHDNGGLQRRPLIAGIPQPRRFQPLNEQAYTTLLKLSRGQKMATNRTGTNDDDGKQRVVDILKEAGLGDISASLRHKLPSWQQVIDQHGEKPVLIGFNASCKRFQQQTPQVRRTLGPAGMFSTGTNLLTLLLKENCRIPARVAAFGEDASKEDLGLRWQVPWGKHTPAMFRENHTVESAHRIQKDDVLPIVTTRNPWRWMQSMCKNPYAAKWEHTSSCPNINSTWNQVIVKYGVGSVKYASVAHLWNDWYRSYLDASFPFVMIRMEDLIFHTKETISAVCACVGGHIVSPFVYVVESAKKGQGHDSTTGLAEAWIKYSQPLQAEAGFGHSDYVAAKEAWDDVLMDLFHYDSP